MLGVGALVVVAIVVVLLAVLGGGTKHSPTTPASASSTSASSPTGTTATTGTGTSATTTPKAQVVGQSNLNPPGGNGQAKGVAFVVKEGSAYGIDALEVHADALADGARVLVHDDLLATGGTAGGVCDLVAGLGAEIAGCAFLVELSFLHGRARLDPYPVHAVLQYDS